MSSSSEASKVDWRERRRMRNERGNKTDKEEGQGKERGGG